MQNNNHHNRKTRRARLVFVTFALLLCASISAQVSINKKWVYGTEEDGLTLIDMSRTDTLIQADAPSAEDIKESHGASKPGIFYLRDKTAYRVKPTSPTSGDIEFRIKDGSYVTGLLYHDLTANNVKFLFEGEFEWDAHVDNNAHAFNANTLELNIDDMSTIFNYRQEDAHALENLCKGKDMRRIELNEDEEYGTIELWGRGLKLNGIDIQRTGDEEAMGMMYCKKNGEYIFVTIAFSDEKLIKEYETQLARNWCFPRRTQETDGKKVVTYANKYWEEESDESVYTFTDNHKGLYTISYFLMF